MPFMLKRRWYFSKNQARIDKQMRSKKQQDEIVMLFIPTRQMMNNLRT